MDFSKINLTEFQEIAREIILLAIEKNIKDRRDFEKLRNLIVKKYKSKIFHNLYFVKAYNDLIKEGKIVENLDILSLIQKRSVRTMSGVAPVTVLMKPYPCPGQCTYCPTDTRMPKSYLPSQPAAQRAYRQNFNPYTQVFVRLKAMLMTGHEVSKVELRVIGGTFSSYPRSYQKWFLKRCLQAMNEFNAQLKNDKFLDMQKISKEVVKETDYGKDVHTTVEIKSLKGPHLKFEDVVKKNELADVKCIGINVETRPDHITKAELSRFRELGVTKVEMGVQTLYDEVQIKTMRGHLKKDAAYATLLLKDAGFKVAYHMMPNLPGASAEMDKNMIRELFENPDFRPDYLKIYPCVVVPKSKLFFAYKQGLYHPYSDSVLEEVLYDNLKAIPYFCRVDRIARDIPNTDVEKGFKASNIRQILEQRIIKEGGKIEDIRFREVKTHKINMSSVTMEERTYEASGSSEYFFSFEDSENDFLIALLRLRVPNKTFIKELKNSVIVREVHVYGRQIAVGKRDDSKKQHQGFGTRLLRAAERRAKALGYTKVAVIAGIGTREYYKKKGYKLEGTYMLKHL